MECTDTGQRKLDRTEEVKVNKTDEDYKEFFDMSSELKAMWDRHLSRINTVKLWIYLTTPDTPPSDSAPCRTGPGGRKLEWDEIDKTLEMKAIKLA